MKEIPKRYDPKQYEKKWADSWVKNKTFASKPDVKAQYSIVIPPPNVTGVLHMGHALNNVLQDIIIRVHKIMKKNTMWMPGTDHGGIATQNVVEKMLLAEGKTRHDLGRKKFLERMWGWKDESGGTIINQLKRIGCGCDWERLRFTMDEQCSLAVKEAFMRLFNEGLIYRGNRMTNWCPRCRTVLADVEVEHEERDSHLWYIKYPFVNGDGCMTVATTRPETMLGDTAVAVNPEDERYKNLIGKKIRLPLTDREIPVIADEFVDREFGTGCVKVTPAHDPNDSEIGKRNNLEKVVVIDVKGKMTSDAGKSYAGLERLECRAKVIEDLKAQGILKKVENYRHAVGTCYRCNTVIEPLETLQWFLKMKDMADMAADAGRTGRVQFFPSNWLKLYLSWLDNINDWCLSRQIWWGHRIPIWYCGKCDGDNIDVFLKEGRNETYSELRKYSSRNEILNNADSIHITEKARPIVNSTAPDTCPVCQSRELIQDPDVLDTWFSSALWPFSTLGWPDENKDIKYYYPTKVLVTGHEILYLWVARMVMMGLKMAGDVPFDSVNIHGIIRDEHGSKMSKSKGNVIDPLEIIEVYGTDSLRFALAKSAVPGRDIQLSDDDFIGARNFCNKLWNATRLILSDIRIKKLTPPEMDKLELVDKWILYETAKFTEEIKRGYLEFNNAYTARQIYDFTWKYFCDWYLELAKIRLYSNESGKQNVEVILINILVKILNLIHPIMPFISSQLWDYLKEEVELPADDILNYNGFELKDYTISEDEVKKMNKLMEIISCIRNIRGENNIQPKIMLKAKIKASGEDEKVIKNYIEYVKVLGGLNDVEVGSGLEKRPGDTVSVAGQVSIFISLPEELRAQEIHRLERRIREIKGQIELSNKKLRNRDFIEKAPKEVVEVARKRAENFLQEFEKLEKTLTDLKNNTKKVHVK